MNPAEIETKIRNFLTHELMKDQALHVGPNDLLDLDSLETTELRAFLTEEFAASFASDDPPSLETISAVVQFVTARPGAL